jgi:hypothetical protein
MDVEVSHITSSFFIHSLSYKHHRRWTPLGSTSCVHMHQGRFAMEGWGNPSEVWSVVEKITKDKQNIDKIGWTKCHASMLRLEHHITNLLGFIGSYKFCVKFDFHKFIQESQEFHLWLIWMMFVCISYLKYLNELDIIFEWHTWMFMFNTQKLHSFMQNFITIISWI